MMWPSPAFSPMFRLPAEGAAPTTDDGLSPRVSIDRRADGLAPSSTLAIQERCAALVAEGRPVVRLGLGQSPFPVPPSVVSTLRANAGRKDYLPVQGLPALREAVAEYHRRRHSIAASPDDVLVAPGSKELLFLLQLVHDGDILIPTPGWVSYEPQARIVGRRAVLLHTRREDGFLLLPEALDALCAAAPTRARVLILNYPSNPTGATYTGAQLSALAEVARRHRLIVLSDEIYGELHFDGRHVSLATHYPEGTIVSGGLSKWCGAGGWRLGTFTFPRALRVLARTMSAVASETYTSTSAPIQYAAVRAFQGGYELERYLAGCRRILRALTTRGVRVLRQCGAEVLEPVGGFYLFPDFGPLRASLARRGIETATQLAARALEETGVAFLPGRDFGRPDEELCARLSLVDFVGARALEAQEDGASTDDDFLDAYCTPVVRALDALATWVSA